MYIMYNVYVVRTMSKDASQIVNTTVMEIVGISTADTVMHETFISNITVQLYSYICIN